MINPSRMIGRPKPNGGVPAVEIGLTITGLTIRLTLVVSVIKDSGWSDDLVPVRLVGVTIPVPIFAIVPPVSLLPAVLPEY